jgi:hypothetical protein
MFYTDFLKEMESESRTRNQPATDNLQLFPAMKSLKFGSSLVRRCPAALVFGLLLAGIWSAAGANLLWTTNSSAINDGPGTWNQGSASVTTGSGAWYNGTSYGVTMQSGDNVTFGGGTAGSAGTITIGAGGVTPGNLTLSSAYGGGGYTLGSVGGPAGLCRATLAPTDPRWRF